MLAPHDLRAAIGGNNPPGPIESAKEAMAEVSSFLTEHPAIQSPDDAKNGGAFVERTRIALSEMETERKGKVEPLNQELAIINVAYRTVREPLEKILKELRRRLTDYATAVEAARIAELNRLEAQRAEAERVARAAEKAEQDAIAAADVGECADVGSAIANADSRFKDFRKIDKATAIAARNVPVKIGSVMGGKSLSMRTVEVLQVTDVHAALKVIGLSDNIRDAILSSARAYRKEFGELPAGVAATFERSL